MVHVFLLLLLFDQVSSQLYPLKKYYYIDIKKTWSDAQAYCRENYHDIAMFQNFEEIQLLSKPQPFSSAYSWIGLLDDEAVWRPHMGNAVNSWIWSATGKPSRTGYQNFDTPGNPNNYAANELCVIMSPVGKWLDINCGGNAVFVCFTGTGTNITYTYVTPSLPWAAAVAYCRLHHTDLVMIEDAETNLKVFNSKPAINIWIGLSRKAWAWADGSPVTYNHWQAGGPTNNGVQYCVREVEGTHQWIPVGCDNLYPFICQKVNTLINKVKVNIQSSANLTDPSLHVQILQKLLEALRARGYNVSELTWSIEPQIQK